MSDLPRIKRTAKGRYQLVDYVDTFVVADYPDFGNYASWCLVVEGVEKNLGTPTRHDVLEMMSSPRWSHGARLLDALTEERN